MASLLARTRNLIAPDRRASAVGIRPSQQGTPITRIDPTFDPYVNLAFKANGVVFACIEERRRVFSDVEFQFQRISDKKLFGNPQLSILERPWLGGTTQDLLDLMMIYNDLGGNAYVHRATVADGRQILQVLRPDWVDIMLTPDRAEIAGYLYWEGGQHSGNTPRPLLADEVAHFFTTPDPSNPVKGMSWLTPVLREIESDKQQTGHAQKYYENAATVNLLVKIQKVIPSAEAREQLRDEFDRKFAGWDNAYKTLILDDGADATPLGSSFEESQFVEVQAQNENKIVVASGVPSILIGISKGLDASTYSNYGMASKAFATKMRPKWKKVAGALEPIVGPLPSGALRLWYDDSDNSAMREDAKDEAEVMGKRAQAIRTYVDSGYTPESAVAAVNANDLDLLQHTQLFSVQLQPANQQPEGGEE